VVALLDPANRTYVIRRPLPTNETYNDWLSSVNRQGRVMCQGQILGTERCETKPEPSPSPKTNWRLIGEDMLYFCVAKVLPPHSRSTPDIEPN
jgi:hypothetical protein